MIVTILLIIIYIFLIKKGIFTPIYDELKSYSEKMAGDQNCKLCNNWTNSDELDISIYNGVHWNGNNQYAYLNRGFCRLDLYYSVCIPLYRLTNQSDKEFKRHLKFEMDFAYQHRLDYRPHIVFGSKESLSAKDPRLKASYQHLPIVLPMVTKSYLLEELHPLKGFLRDMETDLPRLLQMMEFIEQLYTDDNSNLLDDNASYRELIDTITAASAAAADKSKPKPRVTLPSKIRFRSDNGDLYKGAYRVDVKEGVKIIKHGYGEYSSVSGDFYSGEFFNDRRNGHGVLRTSHRDGGVSFYTIDTYIFQSELSMNYLMICIFSEFVQRRFQR